jgi:ketosteroid isomerase-like protein
MTRIYPFLFVLSLLFSCDSNKSGSNDIDTAKEDARKYIESQFDFFVNSSLDEAKNTFSDDAVLIGTDEAEYYTGWDEIKPSIVGQLSIEDPKFSPRDLNIFMSAGGDMASYTQKLDFTFSVAGEPGEIKDVRNSGVIKKVDGEWKIIQIHWSMGVKGQVVEYEMKEE